MRGINFAIGPSCFVRCRGCYNFFGNSYRRGNLVTAAELLDFGSAAKGIGVKKATLSGGDPLTHPQFLPILRGLANLGLIIKVDTVGTSILGVAAKVFYGQGEVAQVSVLEIARYVSVVGLPLDGASNTTIQRFRVGRPDLLRETCEAVSALKAANVNVCINTVVHQGNVDELDELYEIVVASGADQWQLFEFQPTGPLASRNGDSLRLAPGQFDCMVRRFATTRGARPRIEFKSRSDRKHLYFMVDDTGLAWLPGAAGLDRTVLGHITRDRAKVMTALSGHLHEVLPRLAVG